jgi:hypothetical protein
MLLVEWAHSHANVDTANSDHDSHHYPERNPCNDYSDSFDLHSRIGKPPLGCIAGFKSAPDVPYLPASLLSSERE